MKPPLFPHEASKGFLKELLPWLLVVFFGVSVGFWILTVQGCHHVPGVHVCSAVQVDGGMFAVSCGN